MPGYLWVNNEGLYEPLMAQIQTTVCWMVPWQLKMCEVQCGGTSPTMLAVMDAFNWSLYILSKLSSNYFLVISLKSDMRPKQFLYRIRICTLRWGKIKKTCNTSFVSLKAFTIAWFLQQQTYLFHKHSVHSWNDESYLLLFFFFSGLKRKFLLAWNITNQGSAQNIFYGWVIANHLN